MADAMITKFCRSCNRDLPVAEFAKHSGNSTGYQSNCRPCQSALFKQRRAAGKATPRKVCDPVEVERIWVARGGVKLCTKCGNNKRRDQFKAAPKMKDGVTCECKDCRNAHERAIRAPLVKYTAPRKRVWPSDHPDTEWRAVEVANAVDAWQWWLSRAPDWWLQVRGAVVLDKKRAEWRARRHIRRARQQEAWVDPISPTILDRVRNSATNCCWCDVPLTKGVAGKYRPTDATIEHIRPLAAGGAHSLANIAVACAKCNYSRPKRAA